MSGVTEAAFESHIASWLLERGGYGRAKTCNAGDGSHLKPRHGHGLLCLRSDRIASLASVPGSRHPRAVGHAPGPAVPEPLGVGLHTRLEEVCASLRAPRWPSWCPHPYPRRSSKPAATLCWVASLQPALAEPSRKREMVDALRASREVLEASIGGEFGGDTEASQPERLDPGRGL